MRFVLSLIFLLTLYAQPPQEAQRKGPPPPRNLKVLAVEEERPMMVGMRTSLGVMCTHCHVVTDYASDENPKKLTARSMMSMVKEINARFPDGKTHVTCYTCHRGSEVPATAVPEAPK